MNNEESFDCLRQRERLSAQRGGYHVDVRVRGRDSGYATDSPGYSNWSPDHLTEVPSDTESEQEAFSVSLYHDTDDDDDDDDVFVTDMMTVYFDGKLDLDEVDGDEDGAAAGPAAARPRALALPTPAIDIPTGPARQHINFTPPRFYSGTTTFPFPPSPPMFGSPESIFGHRAPPSSLQRSLHIEFSSNRQRSLSDDESSTVPGQHRATLRERVLSETDMARTRTQSEGTVTLRQPTAGFRDRSYSESAIQIRLQRRFGRELRRISDEFQITYTSPSSSPNHGQGSGMRTSRSFPGSNRGSGWWQAIIQQFSPFFGHRLEPIHSPVDVSEDAASDATSDFENDRDHDTGDDLHSKVHFDLNVQDMDDLDGPQ